jgi:hypothetical protein
VASIELVVMEEDIDGSGKLFDSLPEVLGTIIRVIIT